jgi:hypothetical protein
MSGSCPVQRLEWVGNGLPAPGDQPGIYDLDRSFAPVRLLCAGQPSLGSARWGSLTGQEQSSSQFREIALKLSFSKSINRRGPLSETR